MFQNLPGNLLFYSIPAAASCAAPWSCLYSIFHHMPSKYVRFFDIIDNIRLSAGEVAALFLRSSSSKTEVFQGCWSSFYNKSYKLKNHQNAFMLHNLSHKPRIAPASMHARCGNHVASSSFNKSQSGPIKNSPAN